MLTVRIILVDMDGSVAEFASFNRPVILARASGAGTREGEKE